MMMGFESFGISVFEGGEKEVLLAPMGVCIYCGSWDGKLTDEHILPDGLGGHLVLPKASCVECAKKIHKFETNAITAWLGPMRDFQGVKSRKRPGKESSKKYRAFRGDVAQPSDADVEAGVRLGAESPKAPISDVMRGFAFCPWPTHGGLSAVQVPVETQMLIYGDAGAAGGVAMPGDVSDFYRFVAKVGHGYACSLLREEGFMVRLPDHILHNRPFTTDVIGAEIAPPGPARHALQLIYRAHKQALVNGAFWEIGRWYVKVRLFANAIDTVFTVMVGAKAKRRDGLAMTAG